MGRLVFSKKKYVIFIIILCLSGCAASPSSAVYNAARSGNINSLKGSLRLAPDQTWNQCQRGIYGGNALLASVGSDFYRGTEYLLQNGANPNARCHGDTALHLAAQGNDPTSTRILLQYKANPNIRDDVGRTPLFYASYNVAKKLLQNGANINIRDEDGNTAMVHAIQNGKNTAQLLEQYGANRRAAQAVVNRDKANDIDMFDLAMKTAVTGAVVGTVAASNIDAYHGADIISATSKDLWIEGEDDNLANLNAQYNKGDFSIQDESIARDYQQQQAHEAKLAEIKREADKRRQAELQRQAQLRKEAEQQKQAELNRQSELQKQADLNKQAQQRAEALAKQEAEQQRQQQSSAELAQQQALAVQQSANTNQSQGKPSSATSAKISVKKKPAFRENTGNYKLGSMKAGEAKELKGKLTQRNIRVGDITMDTVTVGYSLDFMMGEPLVSGTWKWTSRDTDAELPSAFSIWLKVSNGSSYGYVKLSPTIPDANGKAGFNVTSSPNWNRYMCSFKGNIETRCMDKKAAKALFKGGHVNGFEVSHK